MDNCEFCDLSPEDEKWLFYPNDFWKVYLSKLDRESFEELFKILKENVDMYL